MDVQIGIEISKQDTAPLPKGITDEARTRLFEILAKAGFIMHQGPMPVDPAVTGLRDKPNRLFYVEITQAVEFAGGIMAPTPGDAAARLGDQIRAGELGPFIARREVGVIRVRVRPAKEYADEQTEVQWLRERADRLRELHFTTNGLCDQCGLDFPCPTERILSGDI